MTPQSNASEVLSVDRLAGLVGDDALQPGYPRLVFLPMSSPGEPVNLALNPKPLQVTEYLKVPVAWGDMRTLDEIAVWNSQLHTLDPERRWFDFSSDLAQAACEAMHDVPGWVNLIPGTSSGYAEYAPLYHLIEPAVLQRVGLPVLGSGVWPVSVRDELTIDGRVPASFVGRLSEAWARTIWGRINRQSGLWAFSSDYPVKLLAHNLDYWLPAVHQVMGARLVDESETRLVETDCHFEPASVYCTMRGVTGFCRTSGLFGEGPLEEELARQARRMPLPVAALWSGSEEAQRIIDDIIAVADANERYRGILEAMHANRLEDDFSPFWSRSKADFEKHLRHQHNGAKVTFVELDKADVVLSSRTSVHGNIARNEFMTMLDQKNQQIVVLLESGTTNLGEIADKIGFSDHSPVSRRVDRIRHLAADYFDLR